jgi:hypothetical protein
LDLLSVEGLLSCDVTWGQYAIIDCSDTYIQYTVRTASVLLEFLINYEFLANSPYNIHAKWAIAFFL